MLNAKQVQQTPPIIYQHYEHAAHVEHQIGAINVAVVHKQGVELRI